MGGVEEVARSPRKPPLWVSETWQVALRIAVLSTKVGRAPQAERKYLAGGEIGYAVLEVIGTAAFHTTDLVHGWLLDRKLALLV
jgi:hypothetical protein